MLYDFMLSILLASFAAMGIQASDGAACVPIRIGFKQCSFDLATRVLRSVRFADFACLRFSGMLWSPVSFDRG